MSLSGFSSQDGGLVSLVLSISSEAPSPGQLRLLQQPACKVKSSADFYSSAKAESLSHHQSSNPVIKWGSSHCCRPRPITESAPPSQTRHCCPPMCTSRGRCPQCPRPPRWAAGQTDAEGAGWDYLCALFVHSKEEIVCYCGGSFKLGFIFPGGRDDQGSRPGYRGGLQYEEDHRQDG